MSTCSMIRASLVHTRVPALRSSQMGGSGGLAPQLLRVITAHGKESLHWSYKTVASRQRNWKPRTMNEYTQRHPWVYPTHIPHAMCILSNAMSILSSAMSIPITTNEYTQKKGDVYTHTTSMGIHNNSSEYTQRHRWVYTTHLTCIPNATHGYTQHT